jgi:tRNA pseudouridine(38-40) synthase
VQGHLEAALGKLLSHEVTVAGASRTDAGVHASGQVASFRTERAIPLHGIRRGLNSLLPDAIAIASATEAAEEFHPRFSPREALPLLFTGRPIAALAQSRLASQGSLDRPRARPRPR